MSIIPFSEIELNQLRADILAGKEPTKEELSRAIAALRQARFSAAAKPSKKNVDAVAMAAAEADLDKLLGL